MHGPIQASIDSGRSKMFTVFSIIPLHIPFQPAWIAATFVPLLLQREGKKIVSIEEFIRGFDFSVGDKLNA